MTPRPPTSNRQARIARMQAEARRKERTTRTAIVAGSLAVALAVGGGTTVLVSNEMAERQAAKAPGGPGYAGSTISNDPVQGVNVWQNLTNDPVEGPQTYPMNPGVGGAHNAAWANCGVYDKEIPQQYAVHSLEHGAVWITTNDKATAEDVKALRSKAGQDYILMSPNPSQTDPVVLSAWGHQLRVQSASDPRVASFISTYRQGPQTPEPGASCSGAYDPATGTIAGQMPGA